MEYAPKSLKLNANKSKLTGNLDLDAFNWMLAMNLTVKYQLTK